MKPNLKHGFFLAILAAALYALNAPFSKLLLNYIPSTLMAGFLYIGAGLGMSMIALARKAADQTGLRMNMITPDRKATDQTGSEQHLTRKELPYTIAMILLDIAAPICLLLGLSMTTAPASFPPVILLRLLCSREHSRAWDLSSSVLSSVSAFPIGGAFRWSSCSVSSPMA